MEIVGYKEGQIIINGMKQYFYKTLVRLGFLFITLQEKVMLYQLKKRMKKLHPAQKRLMEELLQKYSGIFHEAQKRRKGVLNGKSGSA